MKAFSTVSVRSGASKVAARATTRRVSVPSKTQPEPAFPIRPFSGLVLQQPTSGSKPIAASSSAARSFNSYQRLQKGLSPDSSDPKAPNTEDHPVGKLEAADLADAEYHEIADQYLNTLQLTLDELADQDAQKGLETEFSVCLFC